jgi:hypothetical protein
MWAIVSSGLNIAIFEFFRLRFIGCTKMASGKHTIILIQYTSSLQSRAYMDFAGVNISMDAIVKLYEHKLKELNPTVPQITYEITDLYKFLDDLADICALV